MPISEAEAQTYCEQWWDLYFTLKRGEPDAPARYDATQLPNGRPALPVPETASERERWLHELHDAVFAWAEHHGHRKVALRTFLERLDQSNARTS